MAMATGVTVPDAPAAVRPAGRLWFVDNLRAALTVLVVVHHLACTYALPSVWYYGEQNHDAATQAVLTTLVMVDQAFFMGLFFLLAGCFTPGSYDRKGGRAFLADRLRRLGIPLLVFTFVLNPVALLPGAWGRPWHGWASALAMVGPGPLWFVAVLLLFSGVYAVARRLRTAPEAARPPRWFSVIGFVAALAVVTYLLRIVLPMGVPALFLPTPSYLPQYAGLFVVGLVAHRRGWLRTLRGRAGWLGLLAAVLATVVLLPLALSGGVPTLTGGGSPQSFAYALWEAVFSVSIGTALLVLFRRRCHRSGRVWSFASGNAYAVYVLHAPLIVGLAVALHPLPLPPTAKFGLAVLVGVPLCWAVAALVRRLPSARRIL